MADDAPSFLTTAAAICVPPHARPQPASFRTLFSTEHAFDAGIAGFDGPEERAGDDGGFAVHFDARGSLPQVVINGDDGQITVTGSQAIRAFARAVAEAEKLAERMAGVLSQPRGGVL